ncbi:hypothetical protein HLBENOHH_00887 [Aeromonas dhakensis]
MGGAIDGLDHKGLDLGLAFTQVLHLAVVDVVGPGAAFGDGQAAQRAGARGAVAGHKLGFIRPIHVGHGQGAALGQGRVAFIFGHATGVGTGDHRSIVDRRNSPGHAASGAVQAIGNYVFKCDVAVEIRSRRKDQLAIVQSDGAVADRNRAAFGNGLAVDGGDGERITIRIRVVAKHIDGDGAIFCHGELVVARLGCGIHHAVVGSLGRGVAHRVGQGGIHRDGAVDRQIRGGDGQSDLGAADIVGRQNSAGVGYAITIPVHIEAIAGLGIARQPDDDIHPVLALIGGDDIVSPVLDVHLRCRGSGTVHTAVIGRGAGVAGRIGDAARNGVGTIRQRRGDIHAESAIRIDGGDQGLLVAIGIGHQQGHGTAGGGIRGTRDGWGSVVGIVRRRDGDHRRHQIDQAVLFTRQCISGHAGIGLIGRIKTRRSYGGIAGTVNGDETTIAAGAGHAANTTTGGRSPTGSRGFKRLGRVGATQNGLLQGSNVIGIVARHVLGKQRLLRRFILSLLLVGRAQGESLVATFEAGALRSDQHGILGQDIAFGERLLAAICGDQVNFAFQLGNDNVLIQCNFVVAHVLS